ncbi:MAG: substrate-binding periplasmic protein [Galactobacter sp.]|uniref:substrate-binding periplasmic protein n=1 Tax=Galactobacter sp. TaxID=2676125 RepID=UPI0025C42663|nr:ABC transporter substrate-binding protein [Galactobacter sp.]
MKLTTTRRAFAGIAILGLGASMALTSCSKSEDTVADDCKPAHENVDTVKDGTLTVGAIDILPFSSYNGGDPEGIDVDIVKQIAKDNCLNVSWKSSTYADAIQSIDASKIDMAIGVINRTEEREKKADFTASTYLDGMGIASTKGYKTIKDLEKAGTVGTIDGYLWVDDLKKVLGAKNVKTYPSSVELKSDYDAGRLDAAIDSYGTTVELYSDVDDITVSLANAEPDDRIGALVQSPQAAFPIKKGNDSLNEAASDTIKEMRKNGEIEKLLADKDLTKDLLGTDEEIESAYSVPN